MRYPVGDDFAIKLAAGLYERLLGKGQNLPRSLQLSLREALESGFNAATPPLSLATPALFGQKAAEVIIKPPKISKREFEMPTAGLSHFPPEPVRFVGRSMPLIQASSALAPESDKRGVLFYGMAGAGKTACALELTYHHSRSPRFQGFVWYKAPDEGKDIDQALIDLAINMETQLPGIKMVHVVGNLATFKNFLPLLKKFLEKNSILIVLDNLESLLTSHGTWRDERWKLLINALLEHNGYSRVILTSRRLPKNLVDEKLIVEPIHSLSLNEAIILSREMTNLGSMLTGRSTVALEKGRELVIRTLELVQGHPMLIKFAEEQAKDPVALEKYLERAARAWRAGSKLKSFFEGGESSQDAEKFLEVLKGWTRDLSKSLTKEERTLFNFLCAIEEADRQSEIAEQVWPKLWKHLGLAGQVPCIDTTLENLKPLVEILALEGSSRYLIHPGVAEASLHEQKKGFRKVVDSELASFWGSMLDTASEYEMSGTGNMAALAGMRSAPYLMRLGQWERAALSLQKTLDRDQSPRTTSVVLPMLNRIARATRRQKENLVCVGILAKALRQAGHLDEAEESLRSLISEYVRHKKFRMALAAESELFKTLMKTGRFREAQELAEKTKDYAYQAGLGPWTQLVNEIQRLDALNKQGRYGEVIDSIDVMLERVQSLTEPSDRKEAVTTWNVKEAILEVGRFAAIKIQNFDQALEFNALLLKIQISRGATELTLARTAFNDYFPLLSLKRYESAEQLVQPGLNKPNFR
jgi:tetratricopeptide (TPR) repeat protein